MTAEAVRGDAAGSVIVDLAGEAGGNCELTEPGRDRRRAGRHDRLAAEPAGDDARARLRAVRAQRAVAAGALVDEDGALELDFDDEIVAGACVRRDDGEQVGRAAA